VVVVLGVADLAYALGCSGSSTLAALSWSRCRDLIDVEGVQYDVVLLIPLAVALRRLGNNRGIETPLGPLQRMNRPRWGHHGRRAVPLQFVDCYTLLRGEPMRLNGWQRIGIVASVIWAIGAPIYLDRAANQEAIKAFSRSYGACREVPSNDPEQCYQRGRQSFDAVPRYPLLSVNGAVAALLPVGLGWLFAYALVYLSRWIRAGSAKQ
jgi:hypothetical protein